MTTESCATSMTAGSSFSWSMLRIVHGNEWKRGRFCIPAEPGCEIRLLSNSRISTTYGGSPLLLECIQDRIWGNVLNRYGSPEAVVFGKKSKRWKPLLQASQKASERSGRLEAMEAEERSLEARLRALEGELAASQARLRTATAEQKALSEGTERDDFGMASSRRVNGAIGDYGAAWSAKQI